MRPLRIIFMGTAEISCPSLTALATDPRFNLIAVVTQPDKPRGRDLKLSPTSVKVLAEKLFLPVLQPATARDEAFIGHLRALEPDLIVVIAFGQILPQAILDLPAHGCLNIHTSLLPKYRGAAPIQWAIANGDQETGVTVMMMDAGLDTGPIVSQRRTPIFPEDDSLVLHDRLALIGAELLVETIPGYVAKKILPRAQPDSGISYAAKINKGDGTIDWTLPAPSICNRIRAFTPWPGSSTRCPGQPGTVLLKILKAEVADPTGRPGEILSADKSGIVVACGSRSLRILELQREGGRRLEAGSFLAGFPMQAGLLLV